MQVPFDVGLGSTDRIGDRIGYRGGTELLVHRRLVHDRELRDQPSGPGDLEIEASEW